MAANTYRVSKDIILDIAEHCDLETLSTIKRTCKDLNKLVIDFEHSISKAKIAATYQPPRDLVLSSEDEQRCTILDRNTFATVHELERRAQRIDSLLNRSGFLLTSDAKILGMTNKSLDKFKAGLRDGIYLADRLADFATEHITPKSPTNYAIELYGADLSTLGQHYHAQSALRRTQASYLRSCPSRSLVWLLTLAAGGSKGYARYSAQLIQSDPSLAAARIMAFKEVLMRHGGSLMLWGFMRGSGTLADFVRFAVTQCAQEVLFFEGASQILGEDFDDQYEYENENEETPNGLHMCIMEELNRRMVQQRRAEAAEKGEVYDEKVDTREVWDAIHATVGKEIGCETWNGYDAIKYPA